MSKIKTNIFGYKIVKASGPKLSVESDGKDDFHTITVNRASFYYRNANMLKIKTQEVDELIELLQQYAAALKK